MWLIIAVDEKILEYIKQDLLLSCFLKESAFTSFHRSFSYFHEVYVFFFFSIPRVHGHARRRSTFLHPFTYPLTSALRGEITVSSLKPLRVVSVDLLLQKCSFERNIVFTDSNRYYKLLFFFNHGTTAA